VGHPFELNSGFAALVIQVLLDSFWQARGVEDVSELGWWNPAREFDCTREGSVCIAQQCRAGLRADGPFHVMANRFHKGWHCSGTLQKLSRLRFQ
jgi:hypothetical protein